MVVNIIILLVGVLIGFIVGIKIDKKKFVGTLYVSKPKDETPLLYLELNPGVIDNVNDNDLLQVQAKIVRENSQK